MAEHIHISIIYADPQRQLVREIEIPPGTTVIDAVQASGILRQCPADFTPAGYGIFGRRVTADAQLREGDRIELYRPLLVDPKEARRRRAKK